MKIYGFDNLVYQFEAIGKAAEPAARKAVHAAAGIVADKVRQNLTNLPEERFRYLRGDQFHGVPKTQKQALLGGLGITPIKKNRDGTINARVGFHEYMEGYPSKKYPKGVPLQLLAGSIESGSSVRRPTPFIRPAFRAASLKAKETMSRVFNEELDKINCPMFKTKK